MTSAPSGNQHTGGGLLSFTSAGLGRYATQNTIAAMATDMSVEYEALRGDEANADRQNDMPAPDLKPGMVAAAEGAQSTRWNFSSLSKR